MVGLALAASARADTAEEAADLILYVDVETKQVFTEPGPNRKPLGAFRRVEKAAGTAPPGGVEPAPAAAAPAAAAAGAAAVESGAAAATAAMPEAPRPAEAPVQGESPVGAADASTAGTPAATPPAALTPEAAAALEERQRLLEERMDKITAKPAATAATQPRKWYENISIRGYMQIRENFTVAGDEDIRLFSDPGVGPDRGLTLRRVRVIISGDVSERLFLYLQPDFASNVGETGGYGQLRDAYGDINFDAKKEFRLRVGQSKIPYSWEDLQSSSNRLALDRNDATNYAANERDLGAFLYWAPAEKRQMFRDLVRNGLKGSGDYGVFAFGVFNGQGANRVEQNDGYHVVSRLTWPFATRSGQIFELGMSGYSGRFVPTTDGSVPGLPANAYRNTKGFLDERVAVAAIMYPQPFGLQAEWNWGHGPALAPGQASITTQPLNGGYIQAMYKIDNLRGTGTWIPFVKWQYFDGAMRFQPNAPATYVKDWEFGVEWQPTPAIEFTMVYHRMDRNDVTRYPYAAFNSDVLRMQLQYNY